MAKVIGAMVLGFFGVLLAMILAPLFGGLSAMAVGWLLPSVPDTIRAVLGISCSNFTLGAALAFAGGFLRYSPAQFKSRK